MKFSRVILIGLIAMIPVAVALAIWIIIRANNQVLLSKDLAAGFLVPRTPVEAIKTGLIIWIIADVALGLVASFIFYFVSTKWHWRPRYFSILVIGIAVLVSVLAFVSGMVFAVEATGEMLIVAVGFGLLIPWLSSRRGIKVKRG